MDLRRTEIEGGELLDHRLVIGLAVRHHRGGERGPCPRHVFSANRGEQPGIGGSDDVAYYSIPLRPERRLFRGRNRDRHQREWDVQRVGRVALHVRFDRLVAPRDGDSRYREAARQTGAHVDRLLVKVPWHVAETSEVAPVLVGALEPLTRRELRPEKGVAVERRLVRLVAHVVCQGANRCAEDLGVDFLFWRELGERDRLQIGQRLRPVDESRLLRNGIDPRKAVGATAARSLA